MMIFLLKLTFLSNICKNTFKETCCVLLGVWTEVSLVFVLPSDTPLSKT